MSLAIVTVSSISSLRRLNKGRLRMKRHLLLGITLVTLAMQSPRLLAEENSAAVAIIAAGKNGNQVQGHLDHLTNRIGPRLTGSDGLQRACEWARESFESMGLQNATMEPWGEFPVGFNRGPATGKMVSPKPLTLQFTTNAWTAGTKGSVTGRAILAPKSMQQLESMRKDLEGAYVFMPRSNRGRTRRGGGPGDIPNGNGRRSNSRPPAVEQPVGLEEAMDPIDPTKLREVLLDAKVAGLISSSMDELLLTGGLQNISWEKIPTVPSIQLQKSQYDEITGMLEKGESVELNFDIRNFFRKGPIPLYNVMADIPGTERPEEMVIVGGHIDSWDGATGATDNGAGCATTMEAARILIASGVRPKRTIRFMLWSGEEQGLLGSMAYVKAHPELMPKISAVFVHDGGTNYVAGIGGTESMLPHFEKVFAEAKTLDEKAPFEIRKVDQILPRGGSDHVSFIQAGVPGFFWDQRGRATYRNTHHTQYDTFDTVVPEYQEHSSIIIALAAHGVANLDTLLPREGVRQGR
ncbi:MAG: M20/M25/M40 family metallo-hydrolase [Pirellulales bacterium]